MLFYVFKFYSAYGFNFFWIKNLSICPLQLRGLRKIRGKSQNCSSPCSSTLLPLLLLLLLLGHVSGPLCVVVVGDVDVLQLWSPRPPVAVRVQRLEDWGPPRCLLNSLFKNTLKNARSCPRTRKPIPEKAKSMLQKGRRLARGIRIPSIRHRNCDAHRRFDLFLILLNFAFCAPRKKWLKARVERFSCVRSFALRHLHNQRHHRRTSPGN